MNQKLLFFGIPGSGKGTQAKLLKEKGFIHISTGDLIRKAFKENDPLISEFKETINSGGFLPDELIFKLIERSVLDSSNYVLDGAVRTIEQAKYALEKNLINKVIFFTLTKEIAEKRLLNRNEGREDDNEESIQKRFVEYNKQTLPIIDFLKEKGLDLIEIDASHTISEVNEIVQKVLSLKD